jgi:hypothetical protein
MKILKIKRSQNLFKIFFKLKNTANVKIHTKKPSWVMSNFILKNIIYLEPYIRLIMSLNMHWAFNNSVLKYQLLLIIIIFSLKLSINLKRVLSLEIRQLNNWKSFWLTSHVW